MHKQTIHTALTKHTDAFNKTDSTKTHPKLDYTLHAYRCHTQKTTFCICQPFHKHTKSRFRNCTKQVLLFSLFKWYKMQIKWHTQTMKYTKVLPDSSRHIVVDNVLYHYSFATWKTNTLSLSITMLLATHQSKKVHVLLHTFQRPETTFLWLTSFHVLAMKMHTYK